MHNFQPFSLFVCLQEDNTCPHIGGSVHFFELKLDKKVRPYSDYMYSSWLSSRVGQVLSLPAVNVQWTLAGKKRARLSSDSSVFALPIFPGRPSIVLALKSMPVACFSKKKPPTFVGGLVFALPIFPGSHPPSIVGVHELNFCVRDGNRWTLMTINTNYVDGS